MLLVFVPLAIFLALGEVMIRVYLSRNTFYDVEMSRYSRVLKLDADNPLIGHVHRPEGEARLMNVSVRINSHGFRDDEVSLNRSARRRIVFLGDSLTFGWGVEKQESFEHLIERELDGRSPTEIINFGTGNYNTVQEVNLFLEKGLAYHPDQVVLFYFINDAEVAAQKSRVPWLSNVRIATFFWSRGKALWARISPSAGFEAYYSALYRDDSEGWRNAKNALLQLRDVCIENGIELQVVLLPELHQLDPYVFEEQHALIVGHLERHGVDVLDLAPSFRNVTVPFDLWVSFDDAHPNSRAHRLIAGYTVDFIDRVRTR
ncbi:MAG: SGNH/GDSL hydrolase family protein [Myxococcota bacterium]|nr:SGNH/GDSL hydrolase family protein [Myxococcota bacterium]